MICRGKRRPGRNLVGEGGNFIDLLMELDLLAMVGFEFFHVVSVLVIRVF